MYSTSVEFLSLSKMEEVELIKEWGLGGDENG